MRQGLPFYLACMTAAPSFGAVLAPATRPTTQRSVPLKLSKAEVLPTSRPALATTRAALGPVTRPFGSAQEAFRTFHQAVREKNAAMLETCYVDDPTAKEWVKADVAYRIARSRCEDALRVQYGSRTLFTPSDEQLQNATFENVFVPDRRSGPRIMPHLTLERGTFGGPLLELNLKKGEWKAAIIEAFSAGELEDKSKIAQAFEALVPILEQRKVATYQEAFLLFRNATMGQMPKK